MIWILTYDVEVGEDEVIEKEIAFEHRKHMMQFIVDNGIKSASFKAIEVVTKGVGDIHVIEKSST